MRHKIQKKEFSNLVLRYFFYFFSFFFLLFSIDFVFTDLILMLNLNSTNWKNVILNLNLQVLLRKIFFNNLYSWFWTNVFRLLILLKSNFSIEILVAHIWSLEQSIWVFFNDIHINFKKITNKYLFCIKN